MLCRYAGVDTIILYTSQPTSPQEAAALITLQTLCQHSNGIAEMRTLPVNPTNPPDSADSADSTDSTDSAEPPAGNGPSAANAANGPTAADAANGLCIQELGATHAWVAFLSVQDYLMVQPSAEEVKANRLKSVLRESVYRYASGTPPALCWHQIWRVSWLAHVLLLRLLPIGSRPGLQCCEPKLRSRTLLIRAHHLQVWSCPSTTSVLRQTCQMTRRPSADTIPAAGRRRPPSGLWATATGSAAQQTALSPTSAFSREPVPAHCQARGHDLTRVCRGVQSAGHCCELMPTYAFLA